MILFRLILLVIFCAIFSLALTPAQLALMADDAASVQAKSSVAGESTGPYILGPEDTLSIRVIDEEEIGVAPYPIDLRGDIKLPIVGSVHAAGLTISQLQTDLTRRFQEYIRAPDITISVAEFRSQPISVLGAVTNPGIHQMRGRKTLFEVISEAGGLKAEAGNVIKVTRRKDFGVVPLPGATTDPSNQFSIGEVSIRSVMQAQNPAQNITIKPYDVVTVPKADLIYVIGEVKKPGGFPLSEKSNISVLEALSLAEGLDHNAGAKNAKILRAAAGSLTRSEIPVDLKRIFSGQLHDMPMQPNDILFIPNNLAKSASTRAIEAMIQIGTGVAIYSKF